MQQPDLDEEDDVFSYLGRVLYNTNVNLKIKIFFIFDLIDNHSGITLIDNIKIGL